MSAPVHKIRDGVIPTIAHTHVTEAHRQLVRSLIHPNNIGTAFESYALRLIADSEAKAVAGQNAVISEWLNRVATVTAERDQLRAELASLTCTHHTDEERRECPVCLVAKLRKEIDWLQLNNDMLTDNPEGHARAVKERADLIAERDKFHDQVALDEKAKASMLREHYTDMDTITKLRAEVEQKRNLLTVSIKSAGDQAIRAEQAEARLAELETANRELLHAMKVIADMWIADTTPLAPASSIAERMAGLALAASLRKHP